MNLYPMKLTCVEKTAIWGGRRLIEEFGKPPLCDPLAEAWELSVREKENCTVENGAFAGKTLKEVLACLGNAVVGAGFSGGHFPLLIKLIDAADDLSVQVHPDDSYAAAMEHDLGKTEMWHILSAEPGASIFYGLLPGVGRAELEAALPAGNILSLLRRQSVQAGETYFIPAGLVHAIGKGVLVAEVQQNSDLTYRVFDYDRRGPDGKPRTLHIKKALDVMRTFTDAKIKQLRYAGADPSALVCCPYFTVRRTDFSGTWEGFAAARSFLHLLFLDGAGEIAHNGARYRFSKGDSFFLPAGLGAYTLSGHGAVLSSSLS